MTQANSKAIIRRKYNKIIKEMKKLINEISS